MHYKRQENDYEHTMLFEILMELSDESIQEKLKLRTKHKQQVEKRNAALCCVLANIGRLLKNTSTAILDPERRKSGAGAESDQEVLSNEKHRIFA